MIGGIPALIVGITLPLTIGQTPDEILIDRSDRRLIGFFGGGA